MSKGPWKVQHKKGDYEFELTVIHEDEKHGQISWGWTGLHNRKLLIAEGSSEEYTKNDMKVLKRIAALIAETFNKEGL